MNPVLSADLFRYTGRPGGRKEFWSAMAGVPGFRFTYAFRQSRLHGRHTLPGLFFRLLYLHCSVRYGFQIPLHTEIGAGLYIGHYGHIVVNGKTRIGRNCNLSPGVVIGQANRGQRKGAPAIGDRVWIGANAVVVGRVRVGSNVLIAPGAFVNFDVPDNSIVVGNPGRITPRDEATAGYVENVVEAGLGDSLAARPASPASLAAPLTAKAAPLEALPQKAGTTQEPLPGSSVTM